MSIKITADSTCDLSKELLEQYDITVIPLYVIKGGKTFQDGVDITPSDIFRHTDSSGELCATAAVNIYDYVGCFGKYSEVYDAVIHISIGSGFSSSHQNACVAAQSFENVYVIDSQNLSTGQGLLVVEAALMAWAGMDAQTICARLNDLKKRVEATFLISRVDYIHKSGRCSLIAALGANILRLCPCIEILDGKMQVTKKYRGSLQRCVAAYIKERLAGRTDIVNDRGYITYTDVPQEVLGAARAAVMEYGAFHEVLETRASCTVSCHCGPGTLGILFIRK